MKENARQTLVRVISENNPRKRITTETLFVTLGSGVMLDALLIPVHTLSGQLLFILVEAGIMISMLVLALASVFWGGRAQWRTKSLYALGIVLCTAGLVIRYQQWINP